MDEVYQRAAADSRLDAETRGSCEWETSIKAPHFMSNVIKRTREPAFPTYGVYVTAVYD